jgi:hypothetical protein
MTHVPAGSATGGQFGTSGGGGSKAPAAKGGAKPPLDAHQKHVAHLQHMATHGTPAQQQAAKAQLARIAAQHKTGKAPGKATAKAARKAAVKPAVKPAAKAAPSPATRKAHLTAEIGQLKTALATARKRHVTTAAAGKAHQAHLAHLEHEIHLLAVEAGKL